MFLFTLFWARDELPLFSRNFSFYFSSHFFTMSVEKEVSALLAESAGDCGVSPEETVDRALQEVERLVEASGQSLYDVCTDAEAASDRLYYEKYYDGLLGSLVCCWRRLLSRNLTAWFVRRCFRCVLPIASLLSSLRMSRFLRLLRYRRRRLLGSWRFLSASVRSLNGGLIRLMMSFLPKHSLLRIAPFHMWRR